MDGGRGSRVAGRGSRVAGRVSRVVRSGWENWRLPTHTRNKHLRPATISQTFETDILILLF